MSNLSSDFFNFRALSAENADGAVKEVRWMEIDGKIVYSKDPDYSFAVNGSVDDYFSHMVVSETISSYTVPGTQKTYSYNVMENGAGQSGLSAWMGYDAGKNYTNSLFAISKHVFVQAAHWNRQLTSWYGCESDDQEPYYGPTSYSLDSNKCTWNGISLTAWANENGFVDYPQLDSFSDIKFFISSQRAKDEFLPYLLDEKSFKGLFHADVLKGLVGYVQQRGTADVKVPAVFGTDYTDGRVKVSTPKYIGASVITTPSVCEHLVDCQTPTYLCQDGDSGKPVAMDFAGKTVLVSHCHQVMYPTFTPPDEVVPGYILGPNYIKAYPIIKAFVESIGDELKTLPAALPDTGE